MSSGYAGKIISLDLTTRTVEPVKTSKYSVNVPGSGVRKPGPSGEQMRTVIDASGVKRIGMPEDIARQRSSL